MKKPKLSKLTAQRIENTQHLYDIMLDGVWQARVGVYNGEVRILRGHVSSQLITSPLRDLVEGRIPWIGVK